MEIRQYYELEGFEEVYLKDSWVLGLEETEDKIEFQMETILTETHPLYTAPKEDEQYCYRKARVVFPNVKGTIWHERCLDKARSYDKDGTADYGNIDSFIEKGGAYHLEGDWGEVTIVSDAPEIHMNQA